MRNNPVFLSIERAANELRGDAHNSGVGLIDLCGQDFQSMVLVRCWC